MNNDTIKGLFEVVKERQQNPQEGSIPVICLNRELTKF